MRILTVEPGPNFSVSDVHRGWTRGLAEAGATVVNVNISDRLAFYEAAHFKRRRRWVKALDDKGAVRMAMKGVETAAYEVWPDAVLFTSAFFLEKGLSDLLRSRGHRVVILHTESPYEDDRQLERASWADLNLINDPTNLDAFRAVAPTEYVPHAYDPDFHRQQPPSADLESDFAFVGTGYASRIAFFEAVDFTGVDVALAGNWQQLTADSPLHKYLAHDIEECCANEDAIALYGSTKASAQLYRREATAGGTDAGWSMAPREVELAATLTFYLTEERGENREVLPMVPTFSDPEDFTEKLRWWLERPDARAGVAHQARQAIASRTFVNHAARLLRLLERLS